MIRNISYNTKELREEFLTHTGKSLSLYKRITMGGNGSQRYVIVEASNELENLANRDNKTNFCNIELRQKGLILRFRSKLETYGWLVPYYLLSVFKSEDSLSIYAGPEFVRLKAAHNSSLDHKFILKILSAKSENSNDNLSHLH